MVVSDRMIHFRENLEANVKVDAPLFNFLDSRNYRVGGAKDLFT